MTGVQLWDSNKSAADRALGFIDITLDEVMQSPHTNGKMSDRRDKLLEIGTDGDMPCTLDWSLGYFSKTKIPPTKLAPQTDDRGIKNIDDPKNKVAEGAAKKLPEATKNKSHKIEQQKVQDKVKFIELEPIHSLTFHRPEKMR